MTFQRILGKYLCLCCCLPQSFFILKRRPSKHCDNEHDSQQKNQTIVWYYQRGSNLAPYNEQHQKVLEEAFQKRQSKSGDKAESVVELLTKKHTFQVDLKRMCQTNVHHPRKTTRKVVRKVMFHGKDTDKIKPDVVQSKAKFQLFATILEENKDQDQDILFPDHDLLLEAYDPNLLPDDPCISLPNSFLATDTAPNRICEHEQKMDEGLDNDDIDDLLVTMIRQGGVDDIGTTRILPDVHHQHQARSTMICKQENDDGHHDDNKKRIKGVQDMDVLCGTTRNLDDHIGNQLYMKLIDENADEYETAPAKTKKRIITEIINQVEEKGRFKYFASDQDAWLEIHDPKERNKKNRDKVRHALGLRAKKKKRDHEQQKQAQQGLQNGRRSIDETPTLVESKKSRKRTTSVDDTETLQDKRSKLDPCKSEELLQNQQLWFQAFIKNSLLDLYDCDEITKTENTPMECVSWEWQQGKTTWNQYSPSNQQSLEEGFRKYQTSDMNIDYRKVFIEASQKTYEIDLEEMKQTNVQSEKTRVIRRRDMFG